MPLGNVTSQLFANIYLNELGQFIKHQLQIKYYIRYCDDFVILSGDRKYLISLIYLIKGFLEERLKLVLHQDKIEIRKYHQGIDFLGYVSFPRHRTLRTSTKKRMLRNIRRKAKETAGREKETASFHQTLWSYLGMLTHCNSFNIRKNLIIIIAKILGKGYDENNN